MIKEIKIHKIATYTNPVTMCPLKINFCYGSNGSGKTTLANLFCEDSLPVDCNISWDNGNQLPVLVYNKKFVEDNFAESKTINGIFTLGQDTKEAQEYIALHRKEVIDCTKSIENQTKLKDKLKAERDKLDVDIEEICWVIQQKYGAKFADALTGSRGSKKAFRDKCIQEYPNMDEKKPPALKEIESLYSVAFGESRETFAFYKEIDTAQVLTNEDCSLLGKRITGSSETPVGKFIEFMQNSDWVKQGIGYATKSEGKCPYCQQTLPGTLQLDIEAYFDETYEQECALVRNFQRQYEAFTNALLSQLKNILDNPIPLLDYELFKSEVEVLAVVIDANKRIIQEKTVSPAITVSIDSIDSIVQRINTIIIAFNADIKRNNDIVQNQANERKRCQKLLWQYFTYELRASIPQYQKEYNGKTSGIKALIDRIKEQSDKEQQHKRLIAEKEETLTSVVPTVNAINGILKRFGFDGFALKENIDEKGTYKIVRPDGSNAKKTLSEGEYNFITFLYFYHLVYGSQDKTGIATDKVVLVDDPISSLDSNVLFIISTLVKTLLKDCKDGNNGIKQIFILTHNVYFHKEVSFLGSRKKYPTTMTAYWVVKKTKNISDIIFREENPIQTSYELLWAELKDVDNHQRVTIFNTLRRILEYYFNVIGGMDYEKCIDQFEGEDKIICKALISCINDGSHFISDDFVMCFERDTMDNYLRVFELIFEKMDHGSHYRMMMGQAESIPLEGAINIGG